MEAFKIVGLTLNITLAAMILYITNFKDSRLSYFMLNIILAMLAVNTFYLLEYDNMCDLCDNMLCQNKNTRF